MGLPSYLQENNLQGWVTRLLNLYCLTLAIGYCLLCSDLAPYIPFTALPVAAPQATP